MNHIPKINDSITTIVSAFHKNTEAHKTSDDQLAALSTDKKEKSADTHIRYERLTAKASQGFKQVRQQEQTGQQFLKQAEVWYLDAQVQLRPLGKGAADSLSALQQAYDQANTAFQRLAELTDVDRGPWVTIDDKPLGISTGVVRFDSQIGYKSKTVQLRNNVDYPITIDRRIGPYWAFVDLGQYDDPDKFVLQPGETIAADILVGLWPPRQIRQRFTVLGDSQIEIRTASSGMRFYLGLGIAVALVLYHLGHVLGWIGIVASPNLSRLPFGNVFMSFLGVAFSAALLLAWFAVSGGIVHLLLALKDSLERVRGRFTTEPVINSAHWIKRGTSVALSAGYVCGALDSTWLNILLLIPVSLLLFVAIGLPCWLLLSILLWMLNAIVYGFGATLFTLVYVIGVCILGTRWLHLYGYTLRNLWTQIRKDIEVVVPTQAE